MITYSVYVRMQLYSGRKVSDVFMRVKNSEDLKKRLARRRQVNKWFIVSVVRHDPPKKYDLFGGTSEYKGGCKLLEMKRFNECSKEAFASYVEKHCDLNKSKGKKYV